MTKKLTRIMVNGVHLYSTFLPHQTKRFTIFPLIQWRRSCASLPSSWGFSVLLKDTSIHGQEEPGMEPPSWGLVDDLLYLLSHSRLSMPIYELLAVPPHIPSKLLRWFHLNKSLRPKEVKLSKTKSLQPC